MKRTAYLSRRNRQGSNQYATKHSSLRFKTWMDISYILACIIIVAGIGYHIKHQHRLLSPVAQAHGQELVPGVKEFSWLVPPTATPTPVPTVSEEAKQNEPDVSSYIEQVFGSDAPKAFELLSCENSSLNPDTVNTAGNYPEGSRDIGVFQVNEYWQGVNAKYLFNYEINILIAKQLYDENDHTFNLWTCGRKLGV